VPHDGAGADFFLGFVRGLNINGERSAGRNVGGKGGVGEGVNEGVGRNEARDRGARLRMVETEKNREKCGLIKIPQGTAGRITWQTYVMRICWLLGAGLTERR
jgi:hypothetical protein